MFNRSKNNPPAADDQPEEAKPVEAPSTPAKGTATGFVLERNKPSVISEGFSFVGDIQAQGVLHVEGSVRGTVSTESVNIGLAGSVNGRVDCASLQIKGSFSGQAQCRELVVSGKARIQGKITYEILSIQRGAVIDGDLICVM